MQEFLDITTQYATGEVVVQGNFNGKAKAAGHLSGGDGDNDPASTQRHYNKWNKD
jgi:hypothetical protein